MKKWIFITLLSLTLNSFSQSPITDDCSNFARSNYEEFGVSAIKSLFKNNNAPKSVEDFLCVIPEEFNLPNLSGEVGENTVFMIKSRSLQQSSFLFPRVIHYKSELENFEFDKDSNSYKESLFFSFTGNHKFNQGNSIEIISVKTEPPLKNKLEFVDITFENKKATITSDPVKCFKCHGLQPKLIWNERFNWPAAAFGATTQSFTRQEDKFKKTIQGKPRFNQFGDNTAINNKVTVSPLFRLNEIVGKINSVETTKKIISSPDYNSYKFAILGALKGCGDIDSFIPVKYLNNHSSKDFLKPASNKTIFDFQLQTINELNSDNKLVKLADFNKKACESGDLEIHSINRNLMSSVAFALNYYEMVSPIISDFLKDTLSKIDEKVRYGFDVDTGIDFNVNGITSLRYLFEGRGLGIAQWSTNVVEGLYNFEFSELIEKLPDYDSELSTSQFNPFIALYKSEFDEKYIKLKIKNILKKSFSLVTKVCNKKPEGSFDSIVNSIYDNDLTLKNNQNYQRVFVSKKSQKSTNAFIEEKLICEVLKDKSLKQFALYPPQFKTVKLKNKLQMALDNGFQSDQIEKYHFTNNNANKINGIDEVPLNPKSKRNCTQCHSGYVANYSGPEFKRTNKDYPLSFLICSNCHSETSSKRIVGPYIPFNDEHKLKVLLQNNKINGLVDKISYRISDKAKFSLDHMPPVLLLNPKQVNDISKYLKGFQ